MNGHTTITCSCGAVEFRLTGEPFLTTECLCESCRTAGAILENLPGAPPLLDSRGATVEAMYRKDRVACTRGEQNLRELRLKPDSPTRRVVAACCNSAMFLDFTRGHWIDMYGVRWPPGQAPAAQMRTMVGDLPPGTEMPDDLPNARTHNVRFFARLLGAWVAMGFRTPKIPFVHGALNA